MGLQGRDKTVVDLVEKNARIQPQTGPFRDGLENRPITFFPMLQCISSPAQITDVMTDFIARPKDNFAAQLDGLALPTEVTGFVRDPFTAATEGDLSTRAKEAVPSIDEKNFILDVVDLQSSLTTAQELSTKGPEKFRSDVNIHKFPNIKKVAIFVLSMFGSTYTCESSFSHMNAIKSNSRCSLTDSNLRRCLRIALTSYEPKITE